MLPSFAEDLSRVDQPDPRHGLHRRGDAHDRRHHRGHHRRVAQGSSSVARSASWCPCWVPSSRPSPSCCSPSTSPPTRHASSGGSPRSSRCVSQPVFVTTWDLAVEKTGGYVSARVVLAFINGSTTSLFMLLIGMPYWLVLGIWTGVVAQFVPTIGTYIAIILPTVVGLLSPEPIDGVLVLAWGLVYQQVENLTIEPTDQREGGRRAPRRLVRLGDARCRVVRRVRGDPRHPGHRDGAGPVRHLRPQARAAPPAESARPSPRGRNDGASPDASRRPSRCRKIPPWVPQACSGSGHSWSRPRPGSCRGRRGRRWCGCTRPCTGRLIVSIRAFS